MQEKLLEFISCPSCKNTGFDIEIVQQDKLEIRTGQLVCRSCKSSFSIKNGIVDLLYKPSKVVLEEQRAHRENDFLPTGIGMAFNDSIRVYRNEFLKLPEGDGSDIFQKPGYFRNVSKSAGNFYESINLARLHPHSIILDCGADTCWASAKLCEMGHSCIAMDINHHLIASDIFIREKGIYFERVIAGMNDLPFNQEKFDVILTVASIHHTGDLEKTLRGFWQVLKRNGKLIMINEPVHSVINLSAKRKFGGYEKEIGIHEQIFNVLEYRRASQRAGFQFEVHIVGSEKYISQGSWKRKAIYSTMKLPLVGQVLKLFLMVFKPFNVTMVCPKKEKKPYHGFLHDFFTSFSLYFVVLKP